MKKKAAIGIDPGVSGAVACISEDEPPKVTPWTTTADASAVLRDWAWQHGGAFALLEKVHAMPGQGVSSTFKLGVNYGEWRGLLTSLGIPFEVVTPLTWQRAMSCQTKGDKNVSTRRAQELFPSLKLTHRTAAALLIAEYNWRHSRGTPGG